MEKTTESSVEAVKRVLEFYYLCFAALLVFGITFQVALTNIVGLPAFFDELVLVFMLADISFRALKNSAAKRALILYAISFIILFALSFSAIGNRGIFAICLQIFIHLKLIIFISYLWLVFGPARLRFVACSILALTALFMFINLATGATFNQIFEVATNIRGGLVRPIGFQGDTASLGTTIALLGIFLVTVIARSNRQLAIIFLAGLAILLFLSSSRTSMIVLPIMVAWWFRQSIKAAAIAGVLVLLLVVTAPSNPYIAELIEITEQNIEWTVDNPVESAYIRGIMIFFSFELANQNFPFGTGAATYGTVMSEESFVYAELGLHNSRFFIETDGIYDSNLASLLGEFGYLGLLIYLALLYKAITLFRSENAEQSNEFTFAICMAALVFGISTPLFMNTYPAFILALVCAASYSEKYPIPEATPSHSS